MNESRFDVEVVWMERRVLGIACGGEGAAVNSGVGGSISG
jgi:hypothetical protein